jgi:hypothetical protein
VTRPLDIVLLLALPASGKSEVRKYLEHLPPEKALRDFHMGPSLQLDDYPYVHLMRRISEVLREAGHEGLFFRSSQESMLEPRDWGTLIELLNEDFDALHHGPASPPESATQWLLRRFDAARQRVGAEPALSKLPPTLQQTLRESLEDEVRCLWEEQQAAIPRHASDLEGRTIVVEFARGGPHGASMPLPAPLGYAYSLARLSDPILERACILYIWVTPEESRRKNRERAKPGIEGDASILHHGVPESVMRGDYGCDDMGDLLERSGVPDAVRIETRGRSFLLPVARFDNRVDKTSFIRADPSQWAAKDVEALHEGLRQACDKLARAASGR